MMKRPEFTIGGQNTKKLHFVIDFRNVLIHFTSHKISSMLKFHRNFDYFDHKEYDYGDKMLVY